MAIPVALQSFKAAGIYRIIYDKSTVLNEDTNILRLVVGYSEKGPFNTPVYCSSVPDFTSMFGNGSKKLEKRGIYFHRLAKQCLQRYPIIALNLKKFADETVSGISISTDINGHDQITPTKYFVGDIYDTTRFWVLDADKLHESDIVNENGTYSKDRENQNNYINIAATGSINDSNTIFIRKASGSKVSSYDVTVSDWYSDGTAEIPEFLQNKLDSQISDYFAEIYVFSGEFTKKQVIASETLQTYFNINGDELTLKPYVLNAYGEKIDTLDALYSDSAAGGINHYVGSLIPYLKNKLGAYVDLSILFNQDVDTHNLMMSFNTDLLETDNPINIDLSCSNDAYDAYNAFTSGTSSVLGNINSPVNVVTYSTEINSKTEKEQIKTTDSEDADVYGGSFSKIPTESGLKDCDPVKYDKYQAVAVNTTISGALVARDRFLPKGCDNEHNRDFSFPSVVDIVDLNTAEDEYGVDISDITVTADTTSKFSLTKDDKIYKYEGIVYKCEQTIAPADGKFYISKDKAVETKEADSAPSNSTDFKWAEVKAKQEDSAAGNYEVVTRTSKDAVKLLNHNIYVSKTPLSDEEAQKHVEATIIDKAKVGQYVKLGAGEITKESKAIYGKFNINDLTKADIESESSSNTVEFTGLTVYDVDSTDKIYSVKEDDTHTVKTIAYFENVTTTGVDVSFVIFDGTPHITSTDGKDYIVRVENSCNQEIGTLKPYYLKGYTYKEDKPAGTDMTSKLDWQKFQLSALTEYKGIRTALLNKSEIDYRYIVDTFESFIEPELKSTLSLLAKEKDSVMLLSNFPAIKTFLKCPFNSYTDSKGNFNVQYVVDGYNKKKAHTEKFSLPSELNGASWSAFYSSLKFSDGYLDDIIPSAGIVSNLFIEKYYTRHPYDIVAGPNHGSIVVSGLTGPDYNFSKEELNIIEPFGVNCMVYRPSFGTFINANQTAKQTPKSALSSINVRELCIYIQDEIEKVLQAYQWEFNNATVRQKIKDRADLVCQAVKNTGGIQDFLNVMDESNNTSEIIDNEMAVISTHIEPGRGMGKMVQELTLYRTGQMRSAISE